MKKKIIKALTYCILGLGSGLLLGLVLSFVGKDSIDNPPRSFIIQIIQRKAKEDQNNDVKEDDKIFEIMRKIHQMADSVVIEEGGTNKYSEKPINEQWINEAIYYLKDHQLQDSEILIQGLEAWKKKDYSMSVTVHEITRERIQLGKKAIGIREEYKNK